MSEAERAAWPSPPLAASTSRALRRYARYLEAKFDRGEAEMDDYATYVEVIQVLRRRHPRVGAGRATDERRRARRPSPR